MHELIAARLVCPECGLYFSERVFHSECTNCGALLGLDVNTEKRGPELRQLFDQRLGQLFAAEPSGVWRYRELVLPTMLAEETVTWPEGNTPLVELDGMLVKHEGMNPTGSFKDRGMTVAISQARRIGAKAVACASTGNTSASLAAYAARAGMPAVVLLPAGKIASGKLAQTVAHGARTIAVDGTFDDCLRLLQEARERLGVYVVNSVNPFRLAGQRSIVYEMLHQLGWNAPDWIALPAGNLGNLSAFGEALRIARAAGLIDRVPRLLAVQAAGAAPFAHWFATGKREVVEKPETIATAIRIGAPASWDRGVRAIRDTAGAVIHVTDADIMSAKQAIDRAGVGCEPASAASVAGVKRLRGDGTIGPNDRVVAVLTGHVLKDPGAVAGGLSEVIQPRLRDLERLVQS